MAPKRTTENLNLPEGDSSFLLEIQGRIQQARFRAALSAQRELLGLYWSIGRDLVLRQSEGGWGQAVIEHLSRDLLKAMPGVQGFSSRNLWRMRAFYLAYPDPGAQNAPPEFLHRPWQKFLGGTMSSCSSG